MHTKGTAITDFLADKVDSPHLTCARGDWVTRMYLTFELWTALGMEGFASDDELDRSSLDWAYPRVLKCICSIQLLHL